MPIHRITVRETNCYLLQGPAGAVLIDPGPPNAAPAIVARAAAVGVQPPDVRLILVTHGHLDHYGTAHDLKAWSNAPVAAYHTEPAFSQERRNALPPAQTLRGSLARWFYLLLSPLFPVTPLVADLPLDDGADLSPYGLDAHVFLVPGHSPGSLAVLTAQGDAFVGDLIVNYTVPSQPIYLSDRDAWQESYERLRRLKPRMVYVGHGEPFPGHRLDRIYPARYQLRWWVR
ncbi:MAG: MBL fold metallo-hydrolase [Anaerolineae bacterium]|nr:MAG: MBL fold metallo-hydrolase [Anaerolineae bacterium]